MVVIDSVEFGEIKINGKIYYSDMIVWWTGKSKYRLKSDIFTMSEFFQIRKKNPEIIVIGTGIVGRLQVPTEIRDLAKEENIKLFVETSEKAVELFNAFINNKKKTVAVMHTTG
ncbi:MAG: MTH938/NDUFAF3 family protein [Candidatus Aenigmatarchaeota archaeon]